MHLEGPPCLPGAPTRVAGQRWPSQHWPVDQLTFDQKEKKKKNQSFLPNSEDQVRNFFEPTATAQPCHIKLALIHEQCSFLSQFWGNEMRNHVLYPTPLIALETSNKEKAVVDTVFCPPQFACWTPKILKILYFFYRATGTSRLTWCNLFGHRGTWSAFYG